MKENHEKSYFKYWGKADLHGEAYHLLPYHCLDVAAVGSVILEACPGIKLHLSRLAGLDSETFSAWMLFLLASHDLGKFTTSFQGLRGDIASRLRDEVPSVSRNERHDTLGYCLWRKYVLPQLRQRGVLPEKLRGGAEGGGHGAKVFNSWMRAATGHHGEPPGEGPRVLSDFLDTANDSEAANGAVAAYMDLFLGAEPRFPPVDEDKGLAVSWWVAGFVVLCDWLGSSRDVASYCAEPRDLHDYWAEALEWAGGVVEESELIPAEIASCFGLRDCFADGEEPVATPLQSAAEKQSIGPGANLFILEDVTGAGKTEAAVLLLHKLMRQENVGGAYFGLPTMATSNGMYERMSGIYRKLYSPGSKPSCVLAHGARDMSEAFHQSIAIPERPSAGDNGDGTMPATAHCGAWLVDNRKKALLAEIGVGTIDQALMAIVPARHQSLRLFGLLGKVLIIDEVHSADAYQNVLIRHLLQAHAMTGGSAILLSATLARRQRREFIDAFASGAGMNSPPIKKSANTDYPLLTHLQAQGLAERVLDTRASVKREVRVEFLYSEQAVAELIEVLSARGKCVCWIRNTVDTARRAHDLLQPRIPRDRLDLFHARYTMEDRLEIEDRVLERFGRNSDAARRRSADGKGQVLVSTQVTEQSLDLCFDVMITDLAPIDLIIQRAGRLQRHARDEAGNRVSGPDRRGEALLYVHAPRWVEEADEQWLDASLPGTRAVYDAVSPWLTQKWLRAAGRFRMPADARAMIEAVYGEQARERLPEKLLAANNKLEGDLSALRSHSGANSLKISVGYQHDGNWWDEDAAKTRDSELPSVSVYLAKWQDGRLEPWAAPGEHRWQRSAVRMSEKKVAGEPVTEGIPAREIERVRRSMPGRGRWGGLLPMVRVGEGKWRGGLKTGEKKVNKLCYEKLRGLTGMNEARDS